MKQESKSFVKSLQCCHERNNKGNDNKAKKIIAEEFSIVEKLSYTKI